MVGRKMGFEGSWRSLRRKWWTCFWVPEENQFFLQNGRKLWNFPVLDGKPTVWEETEVKKGRCPWVFFGLHRKSWGKKWQIKEWAVKEKGITHLKFWENFRLSRYPVGRAESYVVRKLFAEKIKVWLRANQPLQPKPAEKCCRSGKPCGRLWRLGFHRLTRISRTQFQQDASGADWKG